MVLADAHNWMTTGKVKTQYLMILSEWTRVWRKVLINFLALHKHHRPQCYSVPLNTLFPWPGPTQKEMHTATHIYWLRVCSSIHSFIPSGAEGWVHTPQLPAHYHHCSIWAPLISLSFISLLLNLILPPPISNFYNLFNAFCLCMIL